MVACFAADQMLDLVFSRIQDKQGHDLEKEDVSEEEDVTEYNSNHKEEITLAEVETFWSEKPAK